MLASARRKQSYHGLIGLVDVLMILAGGVGMYDDTRQVVVELLKVLDAAAPFTGDWLAAWRGSCHINGGPEVSHASPSSRPT